MAKVHTELPAPHTDPLDVVGADGARETEHNVLLVSGGQSRHLGVPVVIEPALEGVRQHHALPGAGGALSPHPEEGVGPPAVVAEVLDEDLVLLGREVDAAPYSVQGRLELPEQSLDSGEEGPGGLRLQGAGLLRVEGAGVVGAGLGLHVPLLVTLGAPDIARCVGQQSVSPPLPPGPTGDTALTPAAPLAPLTLGAKACNHKITILQIYRHYQRASQNFNGVNNQLSLLIYGQTLSRNKESFGCYSEAAHRIG